jgi:NAD(P)-dependent dehydrogenase (short-subunit alcohol dehydrogenase family)
MLESFKGHAAVVSGGGEGIGRELALSFARAGLSVAILDVDGEAAEMTADAARDFGVKALAIVCDVSAEADLEQAKEKVLSDIGQPRLVWSNAGVGAMGGILSMEKANLDWIYAVNVGGMIATLRAFAAPLRSMDGPRHIGLTASVSGLTGIGAYAAAYGATKYAVIGLGEGLRAELEGAGIGVTIACPGLVNTRIWDAGRARPARYGGETRMPDALGDSWRQHGMSAAWVAQACIAQINRGGGYVSPVDPHSKDDFVKRAAEIESSFCFPST